jgi:hypothetical protein
MTEEAEEDPEPMHPELRKDVKETANILSDLFSELVASREKPLDETRKIAAGRLDKVVTRSGKRWRNEAKAKAKRSTNQIRMQLR